MTTAAPVPLRERLLLQHGSTDPAKLEMFVRLRDPGEHHLYLKYLPFSDFAWLFANEVKPLTALIYRMPTSLLNPSYWEPLTREGEQAVRERLGGLLTRQDGERTLLWRADSIAAGRYLRDGLDVPVQLLHGYIFRVSGESLLKIGAAWAGESERFEWIGFSALPEGELGAHIAMNAHNDITAFRFSLPEQRIAYASPDDSATRCLFADRGLARKLAGTAVRSFVMNIGRNYCAPINDRVADQILRVGDGIGYVSRPETDFTDRGRAYEARCSFGQTEWGVHLKSGQVPFFAEEHALIYYDRTSGIWAVAT